MLICNNVFQYIFPWLHRYARDWKDGTTKGGGKKKWKKGGSKARRRGKNETAQRFIGKGERGNREYASPFRSAAVARGVVRYDCTVCSYAATHHYRAEGVRRVALMKGVY